MKLIDIAGSSSNVQATVESVLANCADDTTVLICGSFFFMGDAKRAVKAVSTLE